MITLLLLVCATYVWVLFFAHIPFVVNRTFNATTTEMLQHCIVATATYVWNLDQSEINFKL